MPQKYQPLFKNVQAEYNQLREDTITWIGLAFLDYIAQVYKIELNGDETLVLTNSSLSQQMTGLGYGINLPALPACKVLYYYDNTLVDKVLRGDADQNTVTGVIKEFFKDYIQYAKVFISSPDTFIKVKHKDLICPKPGAGAIDTLKHLKYGKS